MTDPLKPRDLPDREPGGPQVPDLPEREDGVPAEVDLPDRDESLEPGPDLADRDMPDDEPIMTRRLHVRGVAVSRR